MGRDWQEKGLGGQAKATKKRRTDVQIINVAVVLHQRAYQHVMLTIRESASRLDGLVSDLSPTAWLRAHTRRRDWASSLALPMLVWETSGVVRFCSKVDRAGDLLVQSMVLGAALGLGASVDGRLVEPLELIFAKSRRR